MTKIKNFNKNIRETKKFKQNFVNFKNRIKIFFTRNWKNLPLSAKRKFRNNEATRRSCLNSFWNRVLGRVFQAMVSVMAVNIQFNSPSMVRLSPNWPVDIKLHILTLFIYNEEKENAIQILNILTWNFIKHFHGNTWGKLSLILHDKPSQCHLNRCLKNEKKRLGYGFSFLQKK